MDAFINYIKNTRGELKHVTWPTQKIALIYTVLVIVISAIIAMLLGGFDYVFTGILNQYIR